MSKVSIRPEIPATAQAELKAFDPLVQKLLYYRGIDTAEKAETFFNPDYEAHLHDPFLMPNMSEAVGRIKHAIQNNEKITIYADYDADGIPGAVVLYDFFRMIEYANIDVYIPHRNREGFGLNMQAIESIAENKTNLLITIDCGTADVAEVARAKELGMDVIITDHHKENGEIPDAIVVNHKITGATYPEQVLCGAGVVFKLVQALVSDDYFELTPGKEKWLLDMVGIATLSDMVPLVGENRVLAHYGLLVLRKTPRKGLLHLFKKTGLKSAHITETDIGFTISPRINAASRMGEPLQAFSMLSSVDDAEAAELVAHLNTINDARKGHVAAIVKAVNKKLQKLETIPEVIVAGDPTWQPSLMGLVANSLVETYQRPAFVWGRGDGKEIKGSCRTVPGVSVHALLTGTADMFLAYGGHDEAGGFELKLENVDLLQDALCQVLADMQGDESVEFVTEVDATLGVHDVHATTYNTITKLGPFGVGNEEPVFLIQQAEVVEVVQFGKQNNHLRLVCKNGNSTVEAIAFFSTVESFSAIPQVGNKHDIVATLEKNMWGRQNNIRLRIKDIV